MSALTTGVFIVRRRVDAVSKRRGCNPDVSWALSTSGMIGWPSRVARVSVRFLLHLATTASPIP
jgi:hypothetical protein